MTSLTTAWVFRYERRPSSLAAHSRGHTSIVANSHSVLRLLWPVARAVAEMLTPSTRRLATWLNSLRVQRRPRDAVPVLVLSVCPRTLQRYRRRRPDFVENEPWPTMLRGAFNGGRTRGCSTPSRQSRSSLKGNGAANPWFRRRPRSTANSASIESSDLGRFWYTTQSNHESGSLTRTGSTLRGQVSEVQPPVRSAELSR